MAQLVGKDEIESLKIEVAEIGKSLRSSLRCHTSSFRSSSGLTSIKDDVADECALQWAEIDRLPTFERLRSSLFDDNDGNKADVPGKRIVDVTKLGALERHMFVEKLIKHIENDNLRLLQKMRSKIDKVDVEVPRVEVRYNNLRVEVECEVVRGKPLPTLWSSLKSTVLECAKLPGLKTPEAKITIIDDVSGIIKPGRMTLLLGPPGCGKTTLLKALSGNLDKSLKVAGEVSYNGYKMEEFIPQKTSAYISQNDLHIPEMTVRETLDFAARCLGVGSRPEIMVEVSRREKQAGIIPDPDVDTYMKAISIEGQRTTLQTDYILKILGLDTCADTLVGDAMRRGISGGQKKRLTIGEMIIGPTKALFMDEISNGLDSSTTYQIVACLQQLAHIADATILVALLQPAPETFDLFDDVMLMEEGKIVYHGPRTHVLKYFEDCGFRCPERKGVADFLQEVISRKDQAQYWHQAEPSWSYISVDLFCNKFKESYLGKMVDEELSKPFKKSQSHKNAISFSKYSLSKWALFRACLAREYLLMRRDSFIYVFNSAQLVISASITMTVFLRSQMGVDAIHANSYLGALFFALLIVFYDGFPELSMIVSRLAVLYKQRDLYFYPAWSYTIPSTILKVPVSLLQALFWTSLTYYVIGYSPEPGSQLSLITHLGTKLHWYFKLHIPSMEKLNLMGFCFLLLPLYLRFFRQFILLFAVHFAATSLFRFLASIFRTMVASTTAGTLSILASILFSGFIIPKSSMPTWLKWGFWVSPLTYGEVGLAVNEFLAPRWQNTLAGNTTIGNEVLQSRGLHFRGYFFWLSLGALLGFSILFNIGFTLALTFLNPPRSHAIISNEKLFQIQGSEDSSNGANKKAKSKSYQKTTSKPHKDRLVLPFQPLTLSFQDVQYYVETLSAMREKGFTQKKLQLLSDITGVLRPGVLTALMGVSGAGKTTLLDVLAGRKTSGTFQGDIRIGGYPKIQDTFARISGYCEQSDVHSPQVTVEESAVYSAWLRLHPEIDSKTKYLILLKTGGHIIYSGPLGHHSSSVIKYFEDISGVRTIRSNYNPATWMLEVTSTTAEAELAIDFAQVYKNSILYQNNKALVISLSTPPNSKELHFPTRFSQNGWGQFTSCLWKQHLSYWRSPSYNLMRSMYSLITSLLFGILFWNQGRKINNQQSLFNVLGAMFAAANFLGTNNSSSVLPYVSTERSVLYREKFAGMYGSWAYALAQVTIEVPYLLAQAIAFAMITYPMIGYYWSTYKFFWYLYVVFCTLLYFTYLGMMVVAITPSYQMAAILQSGFYITFYLFSGFLIPQPQIPKWWVWMYHLAPTSWTLKGMLTSQYGDIHKEITVFGETKTVSAFLRDYFGYHHDQLPIVGVVLIIYPIVFASVFAFCIEKLNFQKR
ncbi:hypothetical protein RHGRI_031990 [Rhododendron griersonianum]|uniref:ABC transporter domain-containing protein n=1 Tax=Rhododendron griersonianum TaxID=479676 RepID=A0AAV6IAT0_9ERIC|nr:hypothetical protein RHGRI_031990 [Rhododendron griersonianum]